MKAGAIAPFGGLNMNCFECFFMSYIESLLWSECDDSGEPLDSNYFNCDIDETCFLNMRDECLDFYNSTFELFEQTPDSYDNEQHGHDFALTRNGHGAGYWDRGLGSLGDELTKACEAYGSCNLYVGDDGKVYAFGYEVAQDESI